MKSNDKFVRARYHVKTRFKKKGGRTSFDYIREAVDETYSDDFLKKLIDMIRQYSDGAKLKERAEIDQVLHLM